MNKTIYVALFVLFNVINCKAQFQVYTFSQFQGTYTAITGGTVYGDQTTDDQVFVNPAVPLGNAVGTNGTGLPIGFNFYINGNIYDRIGINANGFIMLGQTTATPSIVSQLSTPFAPISASTIANSNLQYKVVAFGCDIQANGNGEIRLETLGTAPNRTMVVQWTNYRKYNNTGDNFNFQIRLCETSNNIEVVYGSFTNNATTGIAQVGLRGYALTDFNNRFVNAINVWSTSAAGITNTTIANFNSVLLPSTGQVYRWVPPPPCTTTPVSNTVQASISTICPGGSSTLSLINTYSLTGITYNWLASTTSSTGPFTNIAGAGTPILYASNISANTWYQCAIACVNGGSSYYASPVQVITTAAIINQVPYLEDFENILVNNQFPNCSWTASQPSVICQTYTAANTNNRIPNSGSKFASFKSGTTVPGDLFYSNGIQLNAGVTYSANVWYITDGNAGWNELSLLYGASQFSANLTPVATVSNAPIVLNNVVYKPLGGVITVTASGIYYLAVRCRGVSSPAQYLSFDDLSVTLPCSLNQPTLNLTVSSNTVCSGNPVTLIANGLTTYTWSTGATGSTLTVSPGSSGTYSVAGTKSLTGCNDFASTYITVYPSPLVSVFCPSPAVCPGSTLNLIAFGASNYFWSNGSNLAGTVISPTIATTYSVIGTSVDGCVNTATTQVTILPTPTAAVLQSAQAICRGESATLTASGALTYQWYSNSGWLIGSMVLVSPLSNMVYTLVATAANGCTTSALANLQVNSCTALQEFTSGNDGLTIYPVPFKNELTIAIENSGSKQLTITDLSGRIVFEKVLIDQVSNLNLSWLNTGTYLILLDGRLARKIIRLPE